MHTHTCMNALSGLVFSCSSLCAGFEVTLAFCIRFAFWMVQCCHRMVYDCSNERLLAVQSWSGKCYNNSLSWMQFVQHGIQLRCIPFMYLFLSLSVTCVCMSVCALLITFWTFPDSRVCAYISLFFRNGRCSLCNAGVCVPSW